VSRAARFLITNHRVGSCISKNHGDLRGFFAGDRSPCLQGSTGATPAKRNSGAGFVCSATKSDIGAMTADVRFVPLADISLII
jgi:hypothetical protein